MSLPCGLPVKYGEYTLELYSLAAEGTQNAVLINDGMPQGERLVELNQIDIHQIQVLEGIATESC